MRSTIRHELPARDADTFWREVFFDPSTQERIYRELGYHEARVESQEGSLETGLRRRFTFVQRLAVPALLKRFLDPDQRLTEEGEFDPARGEYRFTTTPSGALAGRLTVRGVTRLEPRGDGTVERVCEIELECGIPGVGSLAERLMAKTHETMYERRTEIERRLLRALT